MNRILQQIALYLGLICIGFVSNLSAQADTVVFYIDTIQPLPGELIEVPIKVKNFNEVKGFQFSMEWSTDSLTYDSIGSIGLSGLGAGNFNLNMLDNGSFACVWLDPSVQGLTLPDSSTIFSLFFEPFETCDSTAEIRFTQMPTVFQVDGVDENGQDAIFPYQFLDGLIAARCPDLEADFGMNGEALTTVTACTPFELMLTDSSFGEFGINDWYWESGDGQVSTDTNATFIYSQAGTYQGQLIITDDFTQDTTTFEVVVNPGFDISFNYELDICGSTFVNFSANNLGNTNIISWNWEFGDGASANTQNASHTYNAYETDYLVRLTAMDQNGCVAFAEQTINIPEVDLVDANPFEIELPGCDTASGQITLETFGGIAPYSYTWSHDGNLTDSIASGLSPGTYTVTVTDALGCIGTTTTFLNSIDSFPVVDLGVDTSFCEGGFIQLNAGNQGTSYNWSLDGVLLSENTNQLNANQTGTYIATVTNEYNCSATDTLELDVFPLPIAELGNDTSICTGDTLLLEVPLLGEASYEWQLEGEILASTTNTQAVFEAGIYQLAITDENGCSNTDDFQLSLFELPQITLGPDTAFCEGSSLELNAGTPINTYFWSQNGQAINNPSNLLQVAEAGNYEVIAVNPNQCAASDGIMVDILALPEVDLGADTTICWNEEATFSIATNYEAYRWYRGIILLEDEQSSSFTTSIPETYAVEVESINGCLIKDTIVLSKYDIPLVDIGEDTTLCYGDTLSVNEIDILTDENVEIEWQFNNQVISEDELLFQSGTIEAFIIDSNMCEISAFKLLSITTNLISSLPDTMIRCDNEEISLTQENVEPEYLWVFEGDVASTTNTVQINENGILILFAESDLCQQQDTVFIQNGFLEEIELSDDTLTSCEIIPLSVSLLNQEQFFSSSFQWFFNADEIIGANQPEIEVEENGVYSLFVTNEYGCTEVDSVNIIYSTPVMFSFPENGYLTCLGRRAELVVESEMEVTVEWLRDGTVVENLGVDPLTLETTAGGNYLVNVIDHIGCLYQDSVVLLQGEEPTVDLGQDTFGLCQGDTLLLEYNETFFSYVWQSNGQDLSNEPFLNVATSGVYVSAVNNAIGCLGRDTVVVELLDTTLISIVGESFLCSDLNNFLSAFPSNYSDYLWYLNNEVVEGETDSVLAIENSGWYKLGYVNEFGCYSEDSLEVIISVIESPSLPEDQVLCSDLQVLNTNLEEIYAYEWTFNGEVIQSANADSLIIDQPGIYTVTVFNQDNCSASDTILITQGEVADIELGDDQVLCEGELANFTLNEGFTYTWLLDGIPINGEDSNMLTTDKSGEYMVEVESEDGCVSIDSAEVIIHPLPTIDLEDMATICPEEAYTLDANCDNCTYQWSTGSGEPVIDINTPGEYAVTITNEFDCVASDTFQLNLHPAAEPDLGEDINLCFGEVVELFPGFFSTYDWSIGTDGSTITVVASNGNAGAVVDYWVDVTNPEGCMGSDTITVTFKSLIQAEITAPATDLCMGDSLFLQANGGDFYEWSIVSGDANSIASPLTDSTTVYPKENTTYQVLVANECPADLDTAYFAVNVLPLPQGDAGLDTCIARGTAIELGASGGIQYIWEENQRFPLSSLDIPNPIVAPEDNTAYTVEIIGENGCSLVDTVMVLVAEDPSINIVAVNIITPNGDGKNDFLEFDNLEKFPRNTLKVYNRWGNKVYEQVGYQNDWNGTYNGKPLPAGSYYYVLSFQASQKVVKSALTILRE